MAGALLIVGSADQGDHDAQDDADDQGHGGDQQGGPHALEVLGPAAALEEGLVELEEEALEEG